MNRAKFLGIITAPVALILIYPGLCSADSSVWLEVGNIKLNVTEGTSWTIREISRNGRHICEPLGSAQGTVIKLLDFGWAGSTHYNETLLEAGLLVSGLERPLTDGAHYIATDNIAITRKTNLGSAFLLASTLTITHNQIDEQLTLQALDPDPYDYVSVVYGFLTSRANRLVEFAGYDGTAQLIHHGTSNYDDDSNIDLPLTASVAQYDPMLGDGVISKITVGQELGLKHFIWDRPADNKLYAQFKGIEGPIVPGGIYVLHQRTSFFDAPQDTWRDVAAGMAPEPNTMILIGLGALGCGLRRRKRRGG